MNAVEVNSELTLNRTPRILMIDDDPFSYEMVEAQLFQDGYELLFRNNGLDAVDQVSTLHPDLILLDLMMPGISGIEVCQQIKSTPQLEHIPIIVFSASGGNESVTAGFEAGADEFLTKPVSRAQLRARIRSMLRLKNQYNTLQQTLQRSEAFSRILIHDMRNPLSGIVLYAQLLQKRGELSTEQQQCLRSIYEESQRLRILLDQMQLFNKLQQGQHKLRRRLTDLRAIFGEVAAKQKPRLEAQKIALVTHILPSPMPSVSIDRTLVHHLLEILLSIAARFTPAEAQITVDINAFLAMETEVTADEQSGYPMLQLTISDQGPALPPDVLADLYHYTEEWDVVVPERPKIGVSLALCKMIAEIHEGQLEVTNNEPAGVNFTLVLPIAEEE